MNRIGTFYTFGPLELDVMRIVWERGRATSREVYEALQHKAHTTISTTMGRLVKKGVLTVERPERTSGAHGWSPGVYTPTMTKVEFVTALMEHTAQRIGLENTQRRHRAV